jgi:hypothetical protein
MSVISNGGTVTNPFATSLKKKKKNSNILESNYFNKIMAQSPRLNNESNFKIIVNDREEK